MLTFRLFLISLLTGLLASPAAWAQPAAPATDVLLLTSGQELTGHVLSITPAELTYLAAPAASPDTVRLPTSTVFLVRYANGTREVISQLTSATPPDPSPPALRGLSATQRLALGQHDAQLSYRAGGPYWGTLGATLYLGPLLGLAPAVGIASSAAKPSGFNAPEPALLTDASYKAGYQQQANRIKRRRTWSGYGVATAAYVVLIGALLAGGN